MKIVTLFWAFGIIETAFAGCAWNLNTDLPQADPLYLTSSSPYNLIIPGATGLTLNLNQYMTLTCVGKSNTIFGTGQQELTLPCTANNKLLYNGSPTSLSSLYCSASTLSDVVLTGTSCASGQGTLMNLGFNSTKGFTTLIEVCYNSVKEANIYSINTIYKSIAAAEIDSNRPAFRNQGLSYGTTTANAYKQTEQKTRFTTLLGSQKANQYITTTSFLSRGHVSPDADFLFGLWSTATYFLVNAAPEWQVVNAGNWLRVEDIAREAANQRQEDLKIYSGVHGVLKLPNQSGVLTDIYLTDPQRLPVPKWFWKIIYSPQTTQGIAFVTLNNPHVSNISPSELICTNVCTQTNWNKPEWLDFSKGYTYCCHINNLVSAIGTLSPFVTSGPMIGN